MISYKLFSDQVLKQEQKIILFAPSSINTNQSHSLIMKQTPKTLYSPGCFLKKAWAVAFSEGSAKKINQDYLKQLQFLDEVQKLYRMGFQISQIYPFQKKPSHQTLYFCDKSKMLTIQPIHSSPKTLLCSFCVPQAKEVKLMLKSAITSLKKLLKTSRIKISETAASKERGQGSLGLQRLIKIMYQRHQFELKLSQFCNHSSLQNRLRNHLNCKLQDLEILLEQLCDKVARRNYELELMTVQIKNSEKSAIKLQEISDLCQDNRKNSLNTEQVKQVSRQQEMEVKVQQEPKQTQYISPYTVSYPSPQSGANHEIPYLYSPFEYNMLYFGPMVYH